MCGIKQKSGVGTQVGEERLVVDQAKPDSLLDGVYKVLMSIGLLSCLGSAYIMLFLDIPMYFSRKEDGSKSGIKYLSCGEGIQDALSRRVQTSDWEVWKKEALWITPYFTVGVWLSIGMVLVNFNA